MSSVRDFFVWGSEGRIDVFYSEIRKLINIFADLRIDSSSIPLDLRLCSHLATLSRLCPCPCAFTAQHSVSRDIVTDSREDLTNSVAAAVQGKSKFRGLDCNRGTKSVMKILKAKNTMALGKILLKGSF